MYANERTSDDENEPCVRESEEQESSELEEVDKFTLLHKNYEMLAEELRAFKEQNKQYRKPEPQEQNKQYRNSETQERAISKPTETSKSESCHF